MTIKEAMKRLEEHKMYLTRHEMDTIRGQIRAGDAEGAYKGLRTLTARRKEAFEELKMCHR